MINYITADLKRILCRIPRLFVMLVVYIILMIIIVTVHNGTWNSVSYISMVEQYIDMLPVLLGLVELIAVYSDDFRAKTMQVAIGIGMTRRKIVLSKLVEMFALLVIDLFFFALIFFGMGMLWQVGLSGQQVMEVIADLVSVLLSIISYMSLTMILIFFTQSTGLATLLYLALSSQIISSILGLVLEMDAIAFLHLKQYTLSPMLSAFRARLILGSFHLGSFIGIIVFIMLGYAVTAALFQKRELEF